MSLIKNYRELDVYNNAMASAMSIFEITKRFPAEERYNLTDQIRRSSPSVCTNIAEAWRKRRYRAAFIAKLSDSETEAAETQVSAEIALRCKYLSEDTFRQIDQDYERILGQLIRMMDQADKWLITPKDRSDA